MAQNPKDLTDVTCDACGAKIHPMDRHVRLPTQTLFGGLIGVGVFICAECLQKKLGIAPEVFDVE